MSHISAQLQHFARLCSSCVMIIYVTLSLENRVSPSHMRTLSAQFSECKATFLHDLRRKFFQEAPFIQAEHIDIEGMVKREVAVFDHKIKEILLEIINDNN